MRINFFLFLHENIYVVGTHQKCLAKVLLMSTHNICLRGEIRKMSILFFFFFDEKYALSAAKELVESTF